MTTLIVPALGRFADTVCNPNSTFFGLPVWYKYLNVKPDTTPNANAHGACDFSGVALWPPTDLGLIGLAILDDLLRIAGIVAIAFIVYGGILYVTSQGEPDKTKQAMNTIVNALIGLAVALVAVAFVSFIGNQLK